jgi:hypothetical protein
MEDSQQTKASTTTNQQFGINTGVVPFGVEFLQSPLPAPGTFRTQPSYAGSAIPVTFTTANAPTVAPSQQQSGASSVASVSPMPAQYMVISPQPAPVMISPQPAMTANGQLISPAAQHRHFIVSPPVLHDQSPQVPHGSISQAFFPILHQQQQMDPNISVHLPPWEISPAPFNVDRVSPSVQIQFVNPPVNNAGSNDRSDHFIIPAPPNRPNSTQPQIKAFASQSQPQQQQQLQQAQQQQQQQQQQQGFVYLFPDGNGGLQHMLPQFHSPFPSHIIQDSSQNSSPQVEFNQSSGSGSSVPLHLLRQNVMSIQNLPQPQVLPPQVNIAQVQSRQAQQPQQAQPQVFNPQYQQMSIPATIPNPSKVLGIQSQLMRMVNPNADTSSSTPTPPPLNPLNNSIIYAQPAQNQVVSSLHPASQLLNAIQQAGLQGINLIQALSASKPEEAAKAIPQANVRDSITRFDLV